MSELPSSDEVRAWLRSDLAKRCRSNPNYSLRSYAKLLTLDPSTLAKMINGKRPIGPRATKKLMHSLGPLPLRREQKHAPQALDKDEFKDIHLDDFKLIADWYHYAILELMQTDDFVPAIKFVAKKLNINVHECRDAVSRLERLQMLRIDDRGRWIDCTSGNTSTVSYPYSAPALRQMQTAVLHQAVEALERVDFAERDQTSITVAIDSSRILEAKERIKHFRRELAEFLAAGEKKDRVYQMSFSLFPIS